MGRILAVMLSIIAHCVSIIRKDGPMTRLTQEEKADLVSRMCLYIPLARRQGIYLVGVSGDEITLCLPYREELVGNPDNGALHGGALTLLLDHTLGTASIAHDDGGPHMTPTLDLRIDHLGITPRRSDVFAAARAYRVTRRIAFVEGLAWVESRERPIARATGSWVIMRDVDLRDVLADVAGRRQP